MGTKTNIPEKCKQCRNCKGYEYCLDSCMPIQESDTNSCHYLPIKK